MAGNKTRDGIKLRNILKVAQEIGAQVREGTKHAYILNYQTLRPCPVATSTDARKMVTPWMVQATGMDSTSLYKSLRRGKL